jgi:hypothetical protein
LGHTFSVEISSKMHVKQISLSNHGPERVLVEGNIGELEEIALTEDCALEVTGTKGVLRIDMTMNELAKVLKSEAVDNQTGSSGKPGGDQ